MGYRKELVGLEGNQGYQGYGLPGRIMEMVVEVVAPTRPKMRDTSSTKMPMEQARIRQQVTMHM